MTVLEASENVSELRILCSSDMIPRMEVVETNLEIC